MTPEEVLKFMEAQTAVADVLTSLKLSLIERGWSEHGAEQASISVVVPAMIAGHRS